MPANVLLLLSQGAQGRVAGYQTWQQMAAEGGGTCQVAKGAKGHRILAPVVRRVSDEQNEPDGEARRRLVGFRLVTVFDQTQLVRPPAIPEVGPRLLQGEAPAGVAVALVERLATDGFALVLDKTIAPANGETDFAACTVRVRPSLSPAQRAKTLAHEVAHVRLHAPDGPGGSLPRGLKEVEAESVAWLVAKEAGLTADDYSFPYVATWSGGDVECVRATIERVLPAAREITDSLALALGAARGNGAARLEPVERSEALNLAAALLPRDDASVGLETT